MCKYIYLFLFFTSLHYSQNAFQKTYGGVLDEDSYAAAEVPGGGFIIAGSTKSFGVGSFDFYIIRTDTYGDTVWTRTFGGNLYDYAHDIIRTKDSLYLIAGYTSTFGVEGDIFLLCINENGDSLWSKIIGTPNNDHVKRIIQTSDGGYMICGDYEKWGNYMIRLIKTDANGDTLWSRSFEYGTAEDIDQTSDGGYVTVNYMHSAIQSRPDIYILKTDENGDSLWSRIYGNDPGVDIGFSIQEAADGGLICAGRSDSYGGAGSDDFYLLKTDFLGAAEWDQTFGGTDMDRAFVVKNTWDGGYIIGGLTSSFNAEMFDFYLVKTDANGDSMWTRMYGGNGQEEIDGLIETSDGGFAAVGYTYSFGAGSFSNILLVKTDENGLITDVDDEIKTPAGFSLMQNYPNPFNPSTVIEWNIPEGSMVTIKVYDVLGNEIKALINGQYSPGYYETEFNAAGLAAGIYYYRIHAGSFMQTRKMILLK